MRITLLILPLIVFLSGCAEYVAVQVAAPPNATIYSAPVTSGSGSGQPVFIKQFQDVRAEQKIVSDTRSAPLFYRNSSIIPNGQPVSEILTNELKRHLIGEGFYITDIKKKGVLHMTGLIRKYNVSLGMMSWEAYVDLIITVRCEDRYKTYSLYGESKRTNWGAKSGVEALQDALNISLSKIPINDIVGLASSTEQ